MAIDDDKDGGGVNVQSGADMGFQGGGIDPNDVGVGAVYDKAGGGFGGNIGVTEDRGRELGAQVSQGSADAWGPSFGTKSNIGAAIGTVVGALAGIPGLGLLGAYGPGAVNSIMGRGGTPEMPGIFGAGPGGNSIAGVGASGSGGLLGVGNDTSQADASLLGWLKDAGHDAIDYTSDPLLGYGIRVFDPEQITRVR